jgi:hypothetical protein
VTASRVPAVLRRRVRERAGDRCEHRLLAREDAYFSHESDHIIAEKHGGETTLENLAWACFDCNRFKGSDTASLDPQSGQLVALFDPRTQVWREHFEIDGGRIRPLTPAGRATERLLKLDLPKRVDVGEILSQAGRYPSAK